jgi:hypothetical protein
MTKPAELDADPFGQPRMYADNDDCDTDIVNGRYSAPDPVTGKRKLMTRVTTLARTIADTFLLEQWMKRCVAIGMAISPDLCDLAASLTLEDRSAGNEVADKAMERARASEGANKGTAFHNYCNSVDAGAELSSIVLPDRRADVRAYRDMMDGYGLKVDPSLIERRVYIPELCGNGVMGTFDRLMWVYEPYPDLNVEVDQLIVGDLKTARKIEYGWGEIAIQLALYSRAKYLYDRRTRSYSPMPPVNQDVAYVMHLKPGTAQCELHEINIKAGWEAVQVCLAVRDWNKRKDLARKIPPPIPNYAKQLADAASVEELSAIFWDAAGRNAWSEELEHIGKRRQLELAAMSVAQLPDCYADQEVPA